MYIVRPIFLLRWYFLKLCWKIPLKEPTVYLTFDDGPIPEVTPLVLDILEEKKVKATFFCVGENVQKYPEIFAEIKLQGHQVGNHSFNHVKAFDVDVKSYLENVKKANDYIKSKLFRPPHGQITKRLEKELLKEYKIIMWDVLTGDYREDIPLHRLVKKVCKRVRNGSIVVFHDSLKAQKMLKVLPLIINLLKAQGYQFKMIT